MLEGLQDTAPTNAASILQGIIPCPEQSMGLQLGKTCHFLFPSSIYPPSAIRKCGTKTVWLAPKRRETDTTSHMWLAMARFGRLWFDMQQYNGGIDAFHARQ